MMECPHCRAELNGAGNSYRCPSCKREWEVRFRCDVCGEVPKLLAGCGSASFFCENCKSLKSRRSMEKEFRAAE